MDSVKTNWDPAQRGLLSLDLMDFYPSIKVVELDVSTFFYNGLIVKEKEFKESLAKWDPSIFKQQAVALVCKADTIIPTWVYMMLSEKLHANAAYFDWKDKTSLTIDLWKLNIQEMDYSTYYQKKVVVNANPAIPPAIYLVASNCLAPIVQSLMLGDIGLPKVIFKRKVN